MKAIEYGVVLLGKRCCGWWRGSNGVRNPLARWRVLRPTALVTLIAMGSMIVSPGVQAMRHTSLYEDQAKALSSDVLQEYNRDLDRLKQALKHADLATIAKLRDQLAAEATAVHAQLAQQAQASKGVPAEMDYDAFFSAHHEQLMQRLDAALAATGADQATQLKAASDLLASVGKAHRVKDWNKLPWRVEKPTQRQPNTDASALAAWLAQQGQRHGKKPTETQAPGAKSALAGKAVANAKALTTTTQAVSTKGLKGTQPFSRPASNRR